MRRLILSALLAAVAMCGWAAKNDGKLKVKIDVKGFGDSLVVYRSGHEDQTFVGKDGKFKFELVVDTPCTALLLQPRLLRGDMQDPHFFNVPLVGGEKMHLWETDKSRYDVDGTGFYADYHKVDLFGENAVKEYETNLDKLGKLMANDNVSQEERSKFYKEVLQPSYDRYQQSLVDYIKANPKQEAAMWLLNKMDGLEKMKEAYASFDEKVREGRMKPLYERRLADLEARAKQEEAKKEAEKKQASGLEAPLFTLNDINGQPLALSSLRGKYVVLDFWGSWCVWCIKGFPQMKEYYAKYPGKFEILGVDCSDTEEKWKAAVEKHELPWLHVYCPKDATLLADYGVTAFPTKILIGPDGKIVKSIVGESPAFYTLLDELFGGSGN
jgi:thiol-disulfide isomerase/thioredoxin